MKIKDKNIISITDFARKTNKYTKNLEDGPIAVVKNGKTLFIAAKPNNVPAALKQSIKEDELNQNKKDYLTRLSKFTLKENVYFLMRFESKNITFPEVDSILDSATGFTKEFKFEIDVTQDLMKAWKEIIYSEKKLTVEYIINLNKIIAIHQALEVGKLRDQKVTVGGTDFIPELPNANRTKKKVQEVLEIDPIDGALEYLTWGIKNQLFFDGNKRTSILVANKILKDAGIGLLAIHEKQLVEFNELLNNYYNKESEKESLKKFLKEKCIYNTPDRQFHKM